MKLMGYWNTFRTRHVPLHDVLGSICMRTRRGKKRHCKKRPSNRRRAGYWWNWEVFGWISPFMWRPPSTGTLHRTRVSIKWCVTGFGTSDGSICSSRRVHTSSAGFSTDNPTIFDGLLWIDWVKWMSPVLSKKHMSVMFSYRVCKTIECEVLPITWEGLQRSMQLEDNSISVLFSHKCGTTRELICLRSAPKPMVLYRPVCARHSFYWRNWKSQLRWWSGMQESGQPIWIVHYNMFRISFSKIQRK